MRWCTIPWSRWLLKMAMLAQFLGIPWNFEIFHDRLGPGRWNWGNHNMAWNLVAWCSLPWSGSLYEITTLRLCSHFLISACRWCCCSLNVLLIWFRMNITWLHPRIVYMKLCRVQTFKVVTPATSHHLSIPYIRFLIFNMWKVFRSLLLSVCPSRATFPL